MWSQDDGNQVYYGRIKECKGKVRRTTKLVISYWLPEDNEADAEDHDFKLSELVTDFL